MGDLEPRINIPAALARGVVGALPVVGPLVAEVLGEVIPNRRIERLERLFEELERRMANLDRKSLGASFTERVFVDLLEDGMWQAARATSHERIQQVSTLLAGGLTVDESKKLERKTLLSLLGELNDAEVVVLSSYLQKHLDDEHFWERHEAILTHPVATYGSGQESVDSEAVHESYKNHLVRLGLLRNRYRRPKRGELPEFDERTGSMKASGRDLTALGRLLLRVIGVAKDADF